MTYTAAAQRSTSVLAETHARAALDHASATLDRLERGAEARRARSLALARAAGAGPWSVRFVALEVAPDGQPRRVVVRAPSASVPFLAHRVVVELRAATAQCDCVAASFGKPCRHAGAALLYAVELVKAYTEAERQYWRDQASEGNAAALGF